MRTMLLKLLSVLCITLAVLSPCSAAPRVPQNYVLPTLDKMVDILFANGVIDPNDPRQLVDYVRVKDCTLLERYYGNDFAWNKIRNSIITQGKVLQKDVPSHFIINDVLEISRYNFRTQAFDIDPLSVFKNVNQISLLQQTVFTCNGREVNYADRVLPANYSFRPDVPLSLLRIPMAENMARQILPDIIEKQANYKQTRKIYFSIFLTIDGVAGISNGTAIFAGHTDRIEFFSDADRTQRIKTLLYNSF